MPVTMSCSHKRLFRKDQRITLFESRYSQCKIPTADRRWEASLGFPSFFTLPAPSHSSASSRISSHSEVLLGSILRLSNDYLFTELRGSVPYLCTGNRRSASLRDSKCWLSCSKVIAFSSHQGILPSLIVRLSSTLLKQFQKPLFQT